VTRETADTLASAAHFAASLEPDDAVVTDTMGYGRSTVFDFLAGRSPLFFVETYPLQRGFICAAHGAAMAARSDAWGDASEALPAYLRAFPSPSMPKGKTA
jgi:hypothetical protein